MIVEVAGPGEVLEGELADLLVDVVADGASVGFLAPLDVEDARWWWQRALRQDGTLTWVCRDEGDPGPVLGVVRLTPGAMPNGRHRADVAKLLVRTTARGRGVAGALMQRLEVQARSQGCWLLVLDTRTSSLAQSLYERWGWHAVGTVPDWAQDPDGLLAPTTFMTKRLDRT